MRLNFVSLFQKVMHQAIMPIMVKNGRSDTKLSGGDMRAAGDKSK
jgi:hypothetical protein